MNENPLVSVIVLNYNAGELLLNCIESVKKSAYKNLEIIVVDNISTDKSQKICKEKHPDIKLIQNDENVIICLSGRGDKDVYTVADYLGKKI